VNEPDFEISISLQARELAARVPPDTEVEGENVTLTRRRTTGGLPGRLEPGERYEAVVVAQQLIGEQRVDRDEDASAEAPEA
jgi:hypothetical protein